MTVENGSDDGGRFSLIHFSSRRRPGAAAWVSVVYFVIHRLIHCLMPADAPCCGPLPEES